MGFMLIHEQMLKSYMIARQRFLRPGGRMFPSTGSIIVAPFMDAGADVGVVMPKLLLHACFNGRTTAKLRKHFAGLWAEQAAKVAFWQVRAGSPSILLLQIFTAECIRRPTRPAALLTEVPPLTDLRT